MLLNWMLLCSVVIQNVFMLFCFYDFYFAECCYSDLYWYYQYFLLCFVILIFIMQSVVIPSVFNSIVAILGVITPYHCDAECRYTGCHFAECCCTKKEKVRLKIRLNIVSFCLFGIGYFFLRTQFRPCIIKLITAVIYGFRNKLECFP
jgi:hypothetical protein